MEFKKLVEVGMARLSIQTNLKNPKKISWQSKLNHFTRDFCLNTGLHGFHYMVEGKNPWKTLLWMSICSMGLAFCCFLIYIQLSRFTTEVTSTSYSSGAFPIWERPFPAVTICNNHLVFLNRTNKISQLL